MTPFGPKTKDTIRFGKCSCQFDCLIRRGEQERDILKIKFSRAIENRPTSIAIVVNINFPVGIDDIIFCSD